MLKKISVERREGINVDSRIILKLVLNRMCGCRVIITALGFGTSEGFL